MESHNPPFDVKYKSLLEYKETDTTDDHIGIAHECELPMIDISCLSSKLDEAEREKCKADIVKASQEWGFFQVINHGICSDILNRIREEQIQTFKSSFTDKVCQKNLNYPAGSYRWGTPSPISLKQLSWSESFHIPLTNFSETNNILSATMELFVTKVSDVAQELAEILSEKMNGQDHPTNFLKENCKRSNCYLRMNRYPPCSLSQQVIHGLIPHTDSDFLTIVHQDHIGGLQLVKDGKWVAVKPNQQALIINIGDLFQAWSNGVYKSVEHRVVSNKNAERYSMAYFFCPSYETVIQSCIQPSIYREFSFKEYRDQVQMDVKNLGFKQGLCRFLA